MLEEMDGKAVLTSFAKSAVFALSSQYGRPHAGSELLAKGPTCEKASSRIFSFGCYPIAPP